MWTCISLNVLRRKISSEYLVTAVFDYPAFITHISIEFHLVSIWFSFSYWPPDRAWGDGVKGMAGGAHDGRRHAGGGPAPRQPPTPRHTGHGARLAGPLQVGHIVTWKYRQSSSLFLYLSFSHTYTHTLSLISSIPLLIHLISRSTRLLQMFCICLLNFTISWMCTKSPEC